MNRTAFLLRCVAAALIAAVLPAPASAGPRSLALRETGVFYVGGMRTQDANLNTAEWTGQSLVHYFKPESPTRPCPIVLYPGLGLSSAIWMATPDDRDGWAQIFVRLGFDVYVYDPVETDPSTLPSIPFRRVEDGYDSVGSLPGVRKWSIADIWSRWGFGPSEGVPNAGVRFPLGAVNQFYASWPARIGGGGGSGASAEDEANLAALLQSIGGAYVVAHSAAGPTVFQTARDHAGLVKGIVAVEPTGCPDTPSALWPNPADVPFIAVYGDYIAQRNQTGRKSACQETVNLVANAGGDSRMLDLPGEGTFGNTHLMMQDDNNEAIAAEIANWLASVTTSVPALPDADRGLLRVTGGNPARDRIAFTFRLDEAGPVTVRLVDVAGRVVAVPVDARLAAGEHRVTLDPGAIRGGLAPGLYYVTLEAPGTRAKTSVVFTGR